jgi:hypothetical protein
MNKTLAFSMFAAALFALSLHSVPNVTAAEAAPTPISQDVAAMPAPQEPFDNTPITAVETVGAARGE